MTEEPEIEVIYSDILSISKDIVIPEDYNPTDKVLAQKLLKRFCKNELCLGIVYDQFNRVLFGEDKVLLLKAFINNTIKFVDDSSGKIDDEIWFSELKPIKQDMILTQKCICEIWIPNNMNFSMELFEDIIASANLYPYPEIKSIIS